MTSISLPLRLNSNGLVREEDERQSINDILDLILTTARYSTPSDHRFGFIFNNLRFEMFNENEGVVFDSGETSTMDKVDGLYDKKISGSSKSINTFASDLRDSIIQYEPRLDEVTVSMTYIREERQIYITVKGVIKSTKAEYDYKQIFKVWN